MGARQLLKLALEEKKRLIIAICFMAVSGVSTAGYAYLVGPMIRVLFSAKEPVEIKTATLPILEKITLYLSGLPPIWISVAIVATAMLKGIAFYSQQLLAAQSGQHILHRLRCRLFDRLLRRNPVSGDIKGGDLVARFTADVAEVETAVTKGILAFVRHTVELSFLVILAVALDYRLAALGLIAFPPTGLAIARIGTVLKRRRRAVHDAVGEVGNQVEETVLGLSVIQAFHAEEVSRRQFRAVSDRIRGTAIRAFAARALSAPFNEILAASALAVTLLFAADQIAAGRLLPETFISFFTALFMLYQPVKGLGQAHHAVASGQAALERLTLRETGAPPEDGDHTAATRVPPPSTRPTQQLRLEGISCGYGDGPDILKEISISIEKGERIAVVGSSGAGKTTFFNLLLGFLPPSSGAVYADDQKVSGADLGRYFAPVRQEPFLFNDNIYNNVLMGDADANESAVTAACEAAGVLTFSNKLPRQLHTPVGPMGGQLSVGQRQRVALARALLSKAPVLLLDEVTASLDGRTETRVTAAIDASFADKTVLVVTHRKATAAWSERLVYLDRGTIAADGPSHKLLREDPRISALFGYKE